MSPEDGTLTFEPITTLDEGYYQCIAKNQFGKDLSGLTFLKRAVLGRYPPTTEQVYTRKEGDSLKIPCQEIKSFPQPTFGWALGKDLMDQSPTTLALNRRIQIDENGHLYFAYVTKDDHRDGRVYKCNVFNNYMDTTTGGSYSRINVESGSLANREPTLMYSTPSPRIALRGQEEVRFKCFFSGKPAPRISWVRVGGSLPSGRYAIEAEDTELVIKNIQDSDEGDYQCTATNSAGTSTPIKVRLDVQSKPLFVPGLKPTNMNATEGDKAEFNCQAEAEPAANIDWFVNGERVNKLDPGHRRVFSEDGTKFTIVNLCKDCPSHKSDLMVVQCNASNVHGYKFSSGYLNVLLPTIITIPPKTYKMPKNEKADDIRTVQFDCVASSDDSTPVTIIWYKDEARIYPDLDERLSLSEKNSLIINIEGLDRDEVRDKYQGDYECEATNGHSVDTSAFEFIVGEVAVGPVTTGGVGDLWWIFIIIAVILLLLILLLCCCICMQRNRGDTYPVDEKERANGNDPEKELADSGFHDYHRPEDQEPIKGSRASLTSTIKLDSDDEGSLAEYGDLDAGKFTEDGSFIGQYTGEKKKKKPMNSVI